MNHITQGQVILFCSIAIAVLLMVAVSIPAIFRKKKEKAETYEPHAGKTLGL